MVCTVHKCAMSAGHKQGSAQRPQLVAAARGLSGMGSGGGSISGSRLAAARRGSAAASGLRVALDVASMAAEAPTAFRLHRLYTDGVVLSKTDAAVRGFAIGGSQVGLQKRRRFTQCSQQMLPASWAPFSV
jgi:hypothetical protein